MIDAEARERARERAADAYVTHEEVVLGEDAWVAPMRSGHRMSARVRKENERAANEVKK